MCVEGGDCADVSNCDVSLTLPPPPGVAKMVAAAMGCGKVTVGPIHMDQNLRRRGCFRLGGS